MLIETMSCRVPVIGSDSGEIPNVINNAGLVFREGNIRQLTNELTLLMEDKKRRKKLARKGRQRVLENCTWEKIVEKTHEIYKKMFEKE